MSKIDELAMAQLPGRLDELSRSRLIDIFTKSFKRSKVPLNSPKLKRKLLILVEWVEIGIAAYFLEEEEVQSYLPSELKKWFEAHKKAVDVLISDHLFETSSQSTRLPDIARQILIEHINDKSDLSGEKFISDLGASLVKLSAYLKTTINVVSNKGGRPEKYEIDMLLSLATCKMEEFGLKVSHSIIKNILDTVVGIIGKENMDTDSVARRYLKKERTSLKQGFKNYRFVEE